MSADLPVLEKCRLFIMMAWFFIQSQTDLKQLSNMLELNPELKKVIL